jgi:uncharacterized protein YecE (DUF72 family)
MGKTIIGISGWRYAPWRGVFYPKDLNQDQELAFASRQFGGIELNGSFYSLQRPEYYARWHAQTPSGFVFTVKGSRFISHRLRLRDVEQPLANFLASGIFNLREKLGPFLWQLPPSMRFDAERLETFFAMLPRDGDAAMRLARRRDARMRGRARLAIDPAQRLHHALEVRHESFVDDAYVRLLRRYDIAAVVADTAGKWPYFEDVTGSFVYVRLHGDKKLYASGYSAAALDRWAARIDAWRNGSERPDATKISALPPKPRRSRDVFCFFDNDIKVKAPFDAHGLMQRLGLHASAWPTTATAA